MFYLVVIVLVVKVREMVVIVVFVRRLCMGFFCFMCDVWECVGFVNVLV